MTIGRKPPADMSPLQAVMLLHYYTEHGEAYAARDPMHANSAAVRDQRQEMLDSYLIEPMDHVPHFRVTPIGMALVAAFLSTGSTALRMGAEIGDLRRKMQ